jgi:subtilase family protein
MKKRWRVSSTNSDAVAELRIAKDTPTLFLEMRPIEQADWAGDLTDRVEAPDAVAPAVCLLDSGATRAHPLIEPGLDAADQHAYDNGWGVGDSAYWNGHGTSMSGVALFGDIEAALSRGGQVELRHRLETVKILPPAGQNDPELYGAITEVGIGKAEAQAPRRRRVFCLAVTSEVGLGRGRPSSWSAAIDQLCYGGGDRRRLMVLAAGNLRGDIAAEDYPDRNDLEEIESPAQAWNPLVVGAYTDKIGIFHPDFDGWQPVAPAGELSPASRTSGIWDRQWPIRPDVVFEGGNFAHDGVNPASAIDDLQLLTTHYRPQMRLFENQRGRRVGLASLRPCFGRAARALAGNCTSSRGALGRMDTGDEHADRGGCPGTEGGHASAIRMGRTGYRSRSDECDGRCHFNGRRCASSVSEGWLDDQDSQHEPSPLAVAPRRTARVRGAGCRAAADLVLLRRAQSWGAGMDSTASLFLSFAPFCGEAITGESPAISSTYQQGCRGGRRGAGRSRDRWRQLGAWYDPR